MRSSPTELTALRKQTLGFVANSLLPRLSVGVGMVGKQSSPQTVSDLSFSSASDDDMTQWFFERVPVAEVPVHSAYAETVLALNSPLAISIVN